MAFAGSGLILIAAVRLARVWTTIFGAPVVPDVNIIHSVWRWLGTRSRPRAIVALQVTRSSISPGSKCDSCRPQTTASASPRTTTWERYSRGRSGGQIMRRRATPSSSINANAVVSWSAVERRTDRPASSGRVPPRLDPQTSASRQTLAPAAHRKQSVELAATTSRNGFGCLGGIFVDPYEVAQSHGKISLFGCSEGIDAERVFDTRHKNGEAERIEARVQQHERIGERRELHTLILGHLLQQGDYG